MLLKSDLDAQQTRFWCLKEECRFGFPLKIGGVKTHRLPTRQQTTGRQTTHRLPTRQQTTGRQTTHRQG